ncbi:class I SAM-dependent methyltransferase [Magnetococcus sp. PR-3]|uniref:class I SAM-dependent methyltransferase n=1 Tax=Magnetococcus sp. PR-3 TaxID=3120355 RepID=UPI002FCDFACD
MSQTYDVMQIDWSFCTLLEYLLTLPAPRGERPIRALDVGSGSGQHTQLMRLFGLQVTSIDKYAPDADRQEDFFEHQPDQPYDVILCSHVIEHQRNVGLFLDRIYDMLAEDGTLVITGPKHDPNTFIEGHLTICTIPLFMQNLIYAGFDCQKGKFLSVFNYENGFIVKKAANFSVAERSAAAYQWTPAHQARSLVTLEHGLTVEDAHYFSGCQVWRVKQVEGKDALMFFNPEQTHRYKKHLLCGKMPNIQVRI